MIKRFISVFFTEMLDTPPPPLDWDGDGLDDQWETDHGLDPNDPDDAGKDTDGDGLTNLDEFIAGTEPDNDDSDGDGMPRPTKRRMSNKRKTNNKVPKKDPIFVDGVRPRPMYVDYKDLDLLSKLTNRHGRIVSRRKTGCHAASQHAVAKAIKRARFMALLPYSGS